LEEEAADLKKILSSLERKANERFNGYRGHQKQNALAVEKDRSGENYTHGSKSSYRDRADHFGHVKGGNSRGSSTGSKRSKRAAPGKEIAQSYSG
jgi:hypothetical protein